MPPEASAPTDLFRRLLWWLVAVLLLLGVMSIGASTIVAGKIEQWLAQRGLTAQIDYLHVSIPRLSLLARGVQAENSDGRGFRARELLLDYSWWQLLRGRWKLQQISLDGVAFDLESRAGERGRRWEVGGWALGQGPRRDRDLQLLFERVRIRDSRLCYRHRPAWPTPSCVRFGDLSARDFRLGLQRSGDEPLDLTIGARELGLRNLLMEAKGSDFIDTALVELELAGALYRRPDNRITADSVALQMFGSCPPERLARALPALGRLVGHCATARRLQLQGGLLFSFGRGAEVRWHRANGQGIALRHSDRRWQNWRAQTLAISDFDYRRERREITWRRAGASAFDYCPPPWRNREHHYCIRAGTLKLPDPVRFDWSDGFNADAGPARLQQTRLLDLAGDNRNPLTIHLAELGELSYRGRNRTLSIDGVEMESASGCVPGGLWQQPDYCARLAGLHGVEPVQFRFASKAAQRGFGFASGPLQLAQFRLQRGGQPQFELQQLHWQHIDLAAAGKPLLLRDFGLQSLSGCVPEPLLPERWRPLCADLKRLQGEGHFAWAGGDDAYLILGELQLERLLLSDRAGSGRGLLLQQLAVGEGFYRRRSDGDNPWSDSGKLPADILPVTAGTGAAENADGESDIGAEKGLLPEELARRRAAATAAASGDGKTPSVVSPNLKLEHLSLNRLDGCLPAAWSRLFYRQPQRMPGCFDLSNLRQQQPLLLAWQGGVDLAAAQLALEHAEARTPAGEPLLQLSGLQLPKARLRYLSTSRSVRFSLPGFSLEDFYACLPSPVESTALDIRCAELRELSFGETFALDIDGRGVSVNLDDSRARQISLAEERDRFLVDVRDLSVPRLAIDWRRRKGEAEKLNLEDVSAAELHACLPHRFTLRSGLPRCISTEDLRTVGAEGNTGLAVGETVMKAAPVAEPLWRIDAIEVARLSLTAEALELHGLEVRELLVCGLQVLVPENARGWGLADCVSAEDLNFAGINRIGLAPGVARLQLGALHSEPITLWQEKGEYADVGLQRLSWRKLRWNGGPAVWVADLRIHDFRGCLTGPVAQLAGAVSAAESPLREGCIRLGDLYLPGMQKLSLAAPFSIGGAVQLADLAIGRESGDPWEVARLQLDQFSYGGAGPSAGGLSGASGCLPAGALGDTGLAPCYQLGRVRLGAIERVDTAAGPVTELRGFSIEGVQLIQPDYPAGLPAQLLQLKSLFAARLRFGAGEVTAQQLALEGVASCVPRGYMERVDHCLALKSLSADGSYRAAGQRLALAQLRMQGIQLLSGDGRQLVRGENLALEQLLSDREQFHFLRLQAGEFELFDRRENAPEYHRHSVIGRLAGMEVGELRYDRMDDRLEIAEIDALRPRLIMMRDRAGEYPLLQEIAVLTGAPAAEKPLTRAAEALTEELKFRYHVRQLEVRHGTFTWVDRQDRYRARLPIRAIYLTMFNVSNEAEGPPSTVLLNGRPGGFGEIQLAGTVDYLGSRKWNADLTGYIENTSLIPATPYMANLLGYKILQGQMDALLNIQVRENQVEAFADMTLNKIKVRRVRDEDQLPVKSSFIPLDIALLLLKDGEGNVRFDMPVSGDLYDPKFSFSFIFSHLLQQAIIESLFGYFTPIGIYTLAKFAWARFRAVHFDPIIFQPGSAELSAEARGQLQEMVATLRERPDARPGICGIANARDWQALYPNATPGLGGSRKARESFYRHPPLMLHEEFERLAQERSRKIESLLLDAGIPARELIPCAPDYNGRDFDEPRVEFSN